jgi:hypothetical protein
MYAHDLNGLVLCYVAALPFLYNTVAGDMLWTTLLFGAWWSAKFLFAPALLTADGVSLDRVSRPCHAPRKRGIQ